MTKKKITKKTTTTVVTEEEVVANKTHIICVLDASSSMNTIIDEARDGFNKFLKEQKELDGEATLSVATFSSSHDENNGYDLIYDNAPIDEVKPLTYKEWHGNGMTALNDAIAKSISDAKLSHSNLKKKDRPDRVLVVIVTDGYENASREFADSKLLKNLIKAQEKNDWQFIYLAADQNAVLAANSIGISGSNTARYSNTGAGNTKMFSTMSRATANYRGMSVNNLSSKGASLMNDVTDGTGKIEE